MTQHTARTRWGLLATAAMLVAPAAQAQTAPSTASLTLYGVADACLALHNGNAGSNFQVNGGGCSFGSRFGLRGSEDLGDGYKAYFQLESGFGIDTGVLAQNGRLFGRKAIVGLSGKFGAIEAGRAYAPAFDLLTAIDPMRLGIGSVIATLWSGSPGTAGGRTDNTISYQSPTYAGFNARVLFAPGEQVAPLPSRGGDTKGLGVTYRSEKLLAGMTYAKVGNAADTGDDRATTIAARYDFGTFSLAASGQFGGWEGTRSAAAPASASSIWSRRFNSYMVGGTVNLGADTVSGSYKRYDDRTVSNFDADIWSVVYRHTLSKRTTLYGGLTRLKNRHASNYGASDGGGAYTGVALNGASRVIDLGITHFF
ncbi:porin [Pigmentiphaga litoralis]|uniref:Putative porin n=1 Tax=Pigmentiphaga litoralis TaxID=516702 RepID=A0A7Y9IS69_9BURK|nr:porin [Pigmentiphaga litoralis]NYE24793.1 putative porin [Pigmentiphaga litoralis]NYE81593.1 putative porin [Pigmentiphaga litoralis]